MKKATVLIRDPDRQYEGLRTSLGLLLESVGTASRERSRGAESVPSTGRGMTRSDG